MLSLLFWLAMLFCDHRVFGKFFLSDLAALFLCGFVIIALFLNKRMRLELILLILLLLLLPVLDYFIQGRALPSALGEWVKLFLFLVGGFALSIYFSSKNILGLFSGYPLALFMFFVLLLFHGFPHYADGRFALYLTLGSPNTVGFLLAVGIIFTLFSSPLSAVSTVVQAVMIVLFSVLLYLTFSRSASYGLLIGLVYVSWLGGAMNVRRLGLCLIVLVAVFFYHLIHPMFFAYTSQHITTQQADLARFNVFQDTLKQLGSGRITIWYTTWIDFLHHPSAWLTGLGPGQVSYLNIFHVAYKSTDSFLVMALHSYGFVGLVMATAFCVSLFCVGRSNEPDSSLKRVLGPFFCFTLVSNYSASASQVSLYAMLIVGFLYASSAKDV
jgi:hypothetical protein